MRSMARFSWALWLPLFLIGACAEVDAATTPTTAPLFVRVSGFPPPFDVEVQLEGVKLCQTDTENCTLSDSDGEATIDVPISELISFSLEKDGYAPYLVSVVVPPGGWPNPRWVMAHEEWATEQHERVNAPYPMRGTGTIQIIQSRTGARYPGLTFDLTNATGERWYADEDGNWDKDLSETTTQHSGGFVEVTPGEFKVEVGGTASGCYAWSAWPGGAENTFRMRVREGFINSATIRCTAPP